MLSLPKLARILLAGLAAAACSESPTPSDAAGPLNGARHLSASRTGAPLDVPAVQMDRPPQPRPWDTSEVALTAATAAESGHAVVAFTEPASARALETGLRAAVSAATVTAGLDLLRARGIQIIDFYDAMGAAHVRMDPSLVPVLRASPLVDYVEPRQWGQIEGVPGTSVLAFLPLGTPQTVPWGIQLVKAPEAWSVTTGAGARIYLIDSGMDTTHEDLPHPPGGHCGGAYTGCEDAFPAPHGTHVLGIWTARDNTVGVAGVAPGANAGDVYTWGACDNNGGCSTTEVTSGINAAVFDADVINLSLRTPYDAAQANAVALAWAHNIVLVASAGNVPGVAPGTIVYPANHTNVIGVSGVLPDKTFASTSPCVLQGGGHPSSNYGPHVDIAAPYYALSTVPGGYNDETATEPVGGWCGNSMATAHVSGTAALVRAKNPTWTNQQVVDQVLNTAQDLGPAGWDNQFGRGLVDAAKAVNALDVSISGPSSVFADQTQTWSAVVAGGVTPYTYQWYKDGTPVGTGSSLTTNTGWAPNFTLLLDVTDAASTLRTATKAVTVTLLPPTNCSLEKLPPASGYLRVSWTNSGQSGVSTEVSIWHNGDWNVVRTEPPGITQYFYILGGQTGQFYARVRHVKTGSTPSDYCTTGSVTV